MRPIIPWLLYNVACTVSADVPYKSSKERKMTNYDSLPRSFTDDVVESRNVGESKLLSTKMSVFSSSNPMVVFPDDVLSAARRPAQDMKDPNRPLSSVKTPQQLPYWHRSVQKTATTPAPTTTPPPSGNVSTMFELIKNILSTFWEIMYSILPSFMSDIFGDINPVSDSPSMVSSARPTSSAIISVEPPVTDSPSMISSARPSSSEIISVQPSLSGSTLPTLFYSSNPTIAPEDLELHVTQMTKLQLPLSVDFLSKYSNNRKVMDEIVQIIEHTVMNITEAEFVAVERINGAETGSTLPEQGGKIFFVDLNSLGTVVINGKTYLNSQFDTNVRQIILCDKGDCPDDIVSINAVVNEQQKKLGDSLVSGKFSVIANGLAASLENKKNEAGSIDLPEEGFPDETEYDEPVVFIPSIVPSAGPSPSPSSKPTFRTSWNQVGSKLEGSGNNNAFTLDTGVGSKRGLLFGYSVALSNDGSRLLVGGHDTLHFYTFDGNDWDLRHNFTSNFASDYGVVRISMNSDGNKFIAGILPLIYQYWTGVALIFEEEDLVWTQKGKTLTNSSENNEEREMYGQSVAINEDGTIVAISTDNSLIDDSVAIVVIFEYEDDEWKLRNRINDNGLSGDRSRFGYEIALSSDGTRLIVSDPFASTNNVNRRGSLYLYTLFPFSSLQKIDGADQWDELGSSISMSSDGMFVVFSNKHLCDNPEVMVYKAVDSSIEQYEQMGEPLKTDGDYISFSLSLSSDGSRLALGHHTYDTYGLDRKVINFVYNINDGRYELIGNFAKKRSQNIAVSMSGDGSRVASGDGVHRGMIEDGNGNEVESVIGQVLVFETILL